MPHYTYTAIDSASGREKSGELESMSVGGATAALKVQGLYPIRLAERGSLEKRPVLRMSFGGSFSPKELALFTRRLAALVNSGLPLVRCLDLLSRQEIQKDRRKAIASLAEVIRAGGTLSGGMARHPRSFDRLYLGMIRAAEAGGVLGAVLDRIAHHLEKSVRTSSRVKAAMTYPAVIMAASAGIVTALMVLIVPKFEKIFAGLLKGAPLPEMTRAVLLISRGLQANWPAVLAGLALLVAAAVWLRRTRAGDWLLLKVPVVGGLYRKTGMTQFCRTLGTMLASGVPILQALQLTRDTTGNRIIAGAIDTVHHRVREGEGLAGPLMESGVFPPVVTGMVEVGEETGALPTMLGRAADIYDEEVDQAVTALISVLEPLMIVLMALVVGTIVLALFLPVIRVVQMMT